MMFFTSDTHFGDPRVLRLDKRPFASLAEHDEGLIARWNERVGPDDEVWHLGDFARRADSVHELLARLNGRKHLIIGNNDPPATLAATGWASIAHYVELDLAGHMAVLCHYPFRTWNGIGRRWLNLHGHSHGRLRPQTRQYDVGVDARGMRPVTLAEIMDRRGARGPAP